jgi:nucleotide-binding universal stress UspA family protein
MALSVKATDDNKVQIKKILVPIDGSEYSFNAAKYAIKLAKDGNAQLYCIHVIGSVPYGFGSSPHAIDQ